MKSPRFVVLGTLLLSSVMALWSTGTHARFLLAAAQTANAQSSTAQASGTQSNLKSYTEPIPGSNVTFEMVAIPGGTFQMGSASGGKDEQPFHEVTIKPFYMSATEVTWEEFDIYAFTKDLKMSRAEWEKARDQLKGADAISRPSLPYGDETYGFGRKGRPVINLTHHAAMEYCRWLSEKTGKNYRLPTEAEWEYAARAGAKTTYSFGDDPAKLAEYAWFYDNSDGEPHPVRGKKPNAFGLYDMHGNVAEWTLDYYDPNFYSTLKAGAPAVMPVSLPTVYRYSYVLRGGSWDDEAPALRSAARRPSTPEWSRRDPQTPKSIWWHTDAPTVGFRVVCAPDDPPALREARSKVTRESQDFPEPATARSLPAK